MKIDYKRLRNAAIIIGLTFPIIFYYTIGLPEALVSFELCLGISIISELIILYTRKNVNLNPTPK